MEFFGLDTDDEVIVSYPATGAPASEMKTVSITIDVPDGVRVLVNGVEFD